MHVHSTNTTPDEAFSRMKSLNIRFLFVAGLSTDLPAWVAALKANQFLPALSSPCPGGKAPFVERRCWDGTQDWPDIDWLRTEVRAGRIKALGELGPQYFGLFPDDERLEPYWQLAEEFDIPVAIHLGQGRQARRTTQVRPR
jgi:Tat protein secretion system quality control protein TatD with DNase activity